MFLGKIAKPRGWVQVATAPDQISAGMLEGVLKNEGIPVIVQRPAFYAYTGIGGVHAILVPEDREKEARAMLEQVWPGEERDE